MGAGRCWFKSSRPDWHVDVRFVDYVNIWAATFSGASQFGVALTIALLVGCVVGFRIDPKRTLVLLSFPVATAALLSNQRIFFSRNVILLFVVLVPLAAAGLLYTMRWLRERLAGLTAARRLPAVPSLVAALTVATPALEGSPRKVWNRFHTVPDSRTQVVAWLNEHAGPGERILFDSALEGDWRDVRAPRRTIDLGQPEALPPADLLVVGANREQPPAVRRSIDGSTPVARFGRKDPRARFVVDPRLHVYRLTR